MAYAMEGYNARSKRSYIATAAFNGSIWQYSTQLNQSNMKNEGRLTQITTLPSGVAVSSSNCPAGRILREVGRKLYPGVHPGLAVGDTFNGSVVGTTITNHYWVAVYDNVTGLRGFIDPNASIFAVYNSDKSVELTDAGELQGGTPLARLGSSVFTAGDVVSGGQIRSTAVSALTTVTGTGGTTQAVDPTLSQFFTLTSNASGAATLTLTASSAPAGATVRIYVSATTVQNTVITFGTGFVKSGTLTVTAGAGPVTQNYLITFIGNGTSLIEVGRTAALT